MQGRIGRFRPALALAIGIFAGLGPAGAQTANRNPDIIATNEEAQQSEQVRRRFADVPVAMEAPSLLPGHQGFTSDTELAAFLATLKARSNRLAVLPVGTSQQGRPMTVLLFTAEGRASFAEAKALNRPVLWFIGQQHGNEPAGGESMLALAAWLTTAEAAPLLDKLTVAIVPRANPDGAANFTRGAANRADLNRDHLLMLLPETKALHTAMATLPPDVVFDHHEFSVVNRWIEKFNAIQAVDAMVLHATNPMVPREISSLAEELYRPAVETALKARGLSMFWYYTTSNRRSDAVVSMGGNNPGIARNAFGLRGAVSFLIETRGVGIRREGWQRRVATHVVAARAVLEASANEASRLRAAIDAGRISAAKAEADLVIAARIPANPLTIPLLDPETGTDKPVEVRFQDSRVIQPTATRARAGGYLITEGHAEAVERLRLLGARLCAVSEAVAIETTAYRLLEVRAATDRESINPDQAIKASLEPRRVEAKPGMIFVPMAQSVAGLVAATLEPDTPGSYVSIGIIPIPQGATEAPVYAVTRGTRLPLRGLASDDQPVCGG
jgi:hypothetical protein